MVILHGAVLEEALKDWDFLGEQFLVNSIVLVVLSNMQINHVGAHKSIYFISAIPQQFNDTGEAYQRRG